MPVIAMNKIRMRFEYCLKEKKQTEITGGKYDHVMLIS